MIRPGQDDLGSGPVRRARGDTTMAYAQQDSDGKWRVYDDDCSGVISGPYDTKEAAQAYCDAVNK